MAPTVIVLGSGPGDELSAHLGEQAQILYGRMLSDTLAVAGRVTGTRVILRHAPDFDPALIVSRSPAVHCEAAPVVGAAAVRAALSAALADGDPAVLIGGDLPHLPLARLRDAFTRLESGATVVFGPNDHGRWYLLGLSSPYAPALNAVPGYDERADRLFAQIGRQAIHMLPPWFGVRTLRDLETLCEELRFMPTQVAVQTRALLSIDNASRAVGG
jgi:hypothetical protein